MNRERLAAILVPQEGEAFTACRRAVLAGARFWVAEDPQPASTLLRTYARRDKHTRQRGIETIGFTDAVTKLGALGEELVRLAAVNSDHPPYHFMLFLNADATTVLACLGVDQSWNPNRHPA
ncbi:MAG TPA: hypothetical protein VFB83_01120 [Propionibacteriaceae bacterium]|nr:hypothetical protein [Propionibacteriaceae bacterium]